MFVVHARPSFRSTLLLGAVLTGLAVACGGSGPERRDLPEASAAETARPPAAGEARTVVLAGGCFWCTEAVFEELRGVGDVVSGYAGGHGKDASYSLVSSGSTEHAESIRIPYDPSVITYQQLLEVFFTVAHDPTQLDRQGPDRGRQYRSAVFYADEEQKKEAEAYIAELAASGAFDRPIVTTLEPLGTFYPAEDYHQNYVRLHPTQPYVAHNAIPKIAKVREHFPDRVETR